MKTFHFHFNTEYAEKLRDAVNDRRKQSIDVNHTVQTRKNVTEKYFSWNRICAIMDRLEDTLVYLNQMELGGEDKKRAAFDFYDFINNCFVVIDCIRTMGSIFKLNAKYGDDIEKSSSVFGVDQSCKSTDRRYFEYIRSLCSVHPLCTNHQPEFLNRRKFHCCPFVSWNDGFSGVMGSDADLIAWVYTSERNDEPIIIPLYVSKFEDYLNKWIDLIPKIIEAKNKYTDSEYDKLRKRLVKRLSDCDNNVTAYLAYLKEEYCDRFDHGSEEYFDEYARVFSIKLTDKRNDELLDKYKNAILYSLGFVRNELQNMSFEGYANSGIKYPDKNLETTLFDSLHYFNPNDGIFSDYSYELGKIYDLYPSHGDYTHKYHARELLEAPKELINQYVFFTNAEPDEERIVLVNLTLYLESLTRKCLLNRNIPNCKKYRVNELSKHEWEQLFVEDSQEVTTDGMTEFEKALKEWTESLKEEEELSE